MQIDLRTGVVPISRAASSLAILLKRCAASSGPIVVTQNGYPTGVLLSIDDYSALIAGAKRSGVLAAEPVVEEAAPVLRRRGRCACAVARPCQGQAAQEDVGASRRSGGRARVRCLCVVCAGAERIA